MGDVVPFKIKFISVVASCDECYATYIKHLDRNEIREYEKNRVAKCLYCKKVAVHYCMRCE